MATTIRAPLRKRGQLVSFRQAAYDQGRGRQFRAAQGVVLIDHLHGQFTSRNQHQGGDSGFPGIRFCGLKQALDDRDQKGQRFAGSSLGRGEHVFAGKGLRNGRGLHRGRDGKVKG